MKVVQSILAGLPYLLAFAVIMVPTVLFLNTLPVTIIWGILVVLALVIAYWFGKEH